MLQADVEIFLGKTKVTDMGGNPIGLVARVKSFRPGLALIIS
jgi:hypothetical protein